MLSQADRDSRSPQTGLCFISDRNFVLLGALFAYFIPSSVALVFAVLCRAEVRQLETHLYRGGRNYDWSGRTAAGNLPVLISAGKKSIRHITALVLTLARQREETLSDMRSGAAARKINPTNIAVSLTPAQ